MGDRLQIVYVAYTLLCNSINHVDSLFRVRPKCEFRHFLPVNSPSNNFPKGNSLQHPQVIAMPTLVRRSGAIFRRASLSHDTGHASLSPGSWGPWSSDAGVAWGPGTRHRRTLRSSSFNKMGCQNKRNGGTLWLQEC